MSTTLPAKGFPPLGFRRKNYVTAAGREVADGVAVDEREAEFVRAVFELAAEGLSCSEIGRHLDTRPKEWWSRFAGTRTEQAWGRFAVYNVLRNRLYLEQRVVSRSLWQRAHNSLRARRPQWKGSR